MAFTDDFPCTIGVETVLAWVESPMGALMRQDQFARGGRAHNLFDRFVTIVMEFEFEVVLNQISPAAA